ncbi:TPA: hypothetical protein R1719_001520, partial [Campylobacter lari]|nr:hypothetical protein [Campylobacter lari]
MKKIIYSGVILNVLAILCALYFKEYFSVGFFALLLLVFVFGAYLENSNEQFVDKILNLSKELKNGNFDGRVVYIKCSDKKLKQIADNLNNTIDGLEAYLREINTSIACSQKGEYFRRAIPEGLKGIFVHNIKFINKALDDIEKTGKSVF